MLKVEDKIIVVTGGAGFIGSNICDYFVAKNKIICIDDLSTGRLSNIQELLRHPNFEFHEGSITSIEFCHQVIPENAIVLHNAALGSVSRSIENPVRTNFNNITGFLNVLEISRIKSAEKFIYASSSSTYGDHQSLPKKEEIIGKPLSPYAVTKLTNELYADVFHKTYGLKVIGLRYFNVFGRNQDPNGPYAAVIPRFLSAMLKNEKITVFGDGNQTRDFTHVSNILNAIEAAILVQDKAAFGEVYNVAYGERFSLNELILQIKTVVEESGKETLTEIEYEETRLGDIRDSFAAIDKAKTMLGYVPQTSLTEGLKLMVKEGF